jgi:hypothetical protein
MLLELEPTHAVLFLQGRQISFLVLTEAGGYLGVADDFDDLVCLLLELLALAHDLVGPVLDLLGRLAVLWLWLSRELTADALDVVDHVRRLEQVIFRLQDFVLFVDSLFFEEIQDGQREVPVKMGKDEVADLDVPAIAAAGIAAARRRHGQSVRVFWMNSYKSRKYAGMSVSRARTWNISIANSNSKNERSVVDAFLNCYTSHLYPWTSWILSLPLDRARRIMTSVVPPLIYSLPLSKRPPPSILDYAASLAFNAVFQTGMVGLHVAQLCILPLALSAPTKPYYDALARWTEGLFARLLILIAMVWAPTVIRVTVDDDDDTLDLRKIVQRNEQGIAVGLDLPDRMVMMSNHQVGSFAKHTKAKLVTLYLANFRYTAIGPICGRQYIPIVEVSF